MVSRVTRKIKSVSLRTLLSALDKFDSQDVWENIFRRSLKKMNFGNGGDFTESGEMYVLQYLQGKFLREPKITIFDVGGNVGNYSVALSKVFREKTTIYSFEPSKKTYALFVENTRSIHSIIPHNLGFSDKEYHHTLYTDKEGSGLASVYQRKLDHFGIHMDSSEEIELTTIDSFCSARNIERIHFLKLDIEGHELSALHGAKEMIEKGRIDAIQFEFGGCNIDSRTYFQDFFYLLKDRYHLYRILTNGIHEIPTYRETYEIFVTVNYLAIRK